MTDHRSLSLLLAGAGFISASDEAAELLRGAAGDDGLLQRLVARRLTGEPLAWITGRTTFLGVDVRVLPGVYVPRAHTEALARRAIERLPPDGVAIDLCTGTGAVAAVLRAHHAGARVVGTDLDERAIACATVNGVEALLGDLYSPLPRDLLGRVDVVVGVVPYVPTPSLPYLQRDTFAFESTLAYDGGPDGTRVLRRAIADGVRYLKGGGALLLELGGDQAGLLRDDLAGVGFGVTAAIVDEDGDVRGVEATLTS